MRGDAADTAQWLQDRIFPLCGVFDSNDASSTSLQRERSRRQNAEFRQSGHKRTSRSTRRSGSRAVYSWKMHARATLSRTSPDLISMLLAAGYSDLRTLGREVCGIKRFDFTTAVVVGLDASGYQRRYCYEHDAVARAALLLWDGEGHPDGPWIKCKGAGIDLLNPAWS